ncbi:hypothetical protein ACHAWU_004789 [Discostella pseudostelligera]|uniref:Uncharacterized protein n=1 Tax=Discostella pseudostelligera TaxID=259834 RepID=A0ABD3N537_9STRA
MSTKAVADQPKVARAASILIRAPTLTVREAMLAAEFSVAEASMKWLQRKVTRNLPHKTKRGLKHSLPASSILARKSTGSSSSSSSNISPLTDDSGIRDDNIENVPPPSPPQKMKKQRLTAKQVQDKRENDLVMKTKAKKAHKEATILYDRERQKENNGGMSVRKVEEFIKAKHSGVGPSRATIHRYVVEYGLIGMSPRKHGPEGNIPAMMYTALCMAYGSFLRINQINAMGSNNSRTKLVPIIAETMNISVSTSKELIKRLCRDTAIDMKCDKLSFAEERRVRWTTYANLELWFDSWEKTLIDLGFMEDEGSGKYIIPEHQLRNIINFDETCLSLDGSSINRGGRPAAYYHDPRLPQVGISTSKTSHTTTMITGSNAWGEALPPHFQFMTSAQTDEGKQIRNDCIRYMMNVRGEFGLGEVVSKPVSIGMNEKGGMDEEEFAKYICNAIMPLYPNASPEKGKWVLLKCDSGPGRMNLDLLAELRTSGFILFPGVPNTTAVSQETDQNYGPFKTQYCKNLDAVVDERIKQKKCIQLPPWQVGLIVFGGMDPETNLVVKSAFECGFSRDNCRNAWDKVGAAPLTRACMMNKKVRRSLGDGSDEYQQMLLNIQTANDVSTNALSTGGYNGSVMRREILAIPTTEQITEEHSAERLQLLAKSNTHGKLFTATGGGHLTSDDIFIASEMATREKEKKRLTSEKTRRLRKMAAEEKGKSVLSTKGAEGNGWSVPDVDAVLAWYDVPQRNKLTTKEAKMRAWAKIRQEGKEPPMYAKWTDDDERELLEASKTEITLNDTALGRVQQRKKTEFMQAVPTLTREEWADVMLQREIAESALDSSDNGMGEGASGAV